MVELPTLNQSVDLMEGHPTWVHFAFDFQLKVWVMLPMKVFFKDLQGHS